MATPISTPPSTTSLLASQLRAERITRTSRQIAARDFARSPNSPDNALSVRAPNEPAPLIINNVNGLTPYFDDETFILSIYPLPLFYEHKQGDIRNAGRGVTRYIIPPADRGQYNILSVHPTVAWLTTFDNGLDAEPGAKKPVYTPGRRNAEALVQIWSTGMAGVTSTARPGIAVLPDGVAENTDAFYSILSTLIQQQEEYFQQVVDIVTAKHASREPIPNLQAALTAAHWLYGDDAAKLPWVTKQNFTVNKPCVLCGAQISVRAIRCNSCSGDILQFYQQHGFSAEGTDPVIHLYQVAAEKFKRIPTPEMLDEVLLGNQPEAVVMKAWARTEQVRTEQVKEVNRKG